MVNFAKLYDRNITIKDYLEISTIFSSYLEDCVADGVCSVHNKISDVIEVLKDAQLFIED
ncbi:MAG: hypothetical protein RBU23_05145 [Candidatus Auribacterota bacterium]|jgi:hypothetical protein|nr:hypothetical protein [Candidatus Auribacterota bacterium]